MTDPGNPGDGKDTESEPATEETTEEKELRGHQLAPDQLTASRSGGPTPPCGTTTGKRMNPGEEWPFGTREMTRRKRHGAGAHSPHRRPGPAPYPDRALGRARTARAARP